MTLTYFRGFIKKPRIFFFRPLSIISSNVNPTKAPKTLFEKVWEDHVVHKEDEGTCLIYIDRHLVHEVTSPQAFEGLRSNNRTVRMPKRTLVTPDHNVSTATNRLEVKTFTDQASKEQVEALDMNAKLFKLPYFPLSDVRQGIVHIVGPEQGFTLPGMTIVCGDSHTSTHGAFGSLAFGIGTSEVEHVLATQTLLQKPAKNMLVNVKGSLSLGVTSKDVVLHVIGIIGTAGGTGHVIEFAGEVIENCSMEARMTICNMAIEAGARAGMIAPDDVTFNYLKGRPLSPKGEVWSKAVEYWKTLKTDANAVYDKVIEIEGKDIAPQVTWGTNPEMVSSIDAGVPLPSTEAHGRALAYMGLEGGEAFENIPVDKVFIGSCTNGRIEDLRLVATLVKDFKVHPGIKEALVVPGSGLVKKQAEEEGIADILQEAGFVWRAPGCSMCLGMNEDQLSPKERCASTSNRNFEGRQGKKGRTHLVSPATAAAAAVTGHLSDLRKVFGQTKRLFSSSAGLKPFKSVKGIPAPLDMTNVDTDMIIPAQHLKTIKRSGLGKYAFESIRFLGDGKENKEFVLNKEPYHNSSILITGANFGCGSSREHAPWALLDLGVKVIISESFADIFWNNCFKNGILPVTLNPAEISELFSVAHQLDEIDVDLQNQIITLPEGRQIPFEVEEFRKYCLLNGYDDIGLTMQKLKLIEEYEDKRAHRHPWF